MALFLCNRADHVAERIGFDWIAKAVHSVVSDSMPVRCLKPDLLPPYRAIASPCPARPVCAAISSSDPECALADGPDICPPSP